MGLALGYAISANCTIGGQTRVGDDFLRDEPTGAASDQFGGAEGDEDRTVGGIASVRPRSHRLSVRRDRTRVGPRHHFSINNHAGAVAM